MSDRPRFTILGKAISFLLVIGLVALGAVMLMRGGSVPGVGGGDAEGADGDAPEISEVQVEVPRLSPPAAFNYKDNTVPIEISEYAGYAGLIAANGGMEPSPARRAPLKPRTRRSSVRLPATTATSSGLGRGGVGPVATRAARDSGGRSGRQRRRRRRTRRRCGLGRRRPDA